MEIKPNKAMSPEEYRKTEDYKERAYSYTYRRMVDDLRGNPIVYDGHPYCSTRKLHKKLERDFGSVKRIISKNLWRFKNFTGTVELGVYYPDGKNVKSVWLKVGKLKLAIWAEDKFDIREVPDASLLNFFITEWDNIQQDAKTA